ncbi:MAG: DUF421 domain-containing protein [Saprospiraceae bacterium]
MFNPDQVLQFLMGKESFDFLWETVLRTIFMFLVIISGIKLMGKRGVGQLSVFELVVIIGLGSAAGDPMFYKDVGILPATLVFVVVILLYRSVTYLMGRSRKIEDLLEGKPIYLIEDGQFCIDDFNKEPLAQEEFFMELRLHNVTHLGQVNLALLETNGQMSVVYTEDKKVSFGLPILPKEFNKQVSKTTSTAHYSCAFCGFTEMMEEKKSRTCPKCSQKSWVLSSNAKRIT